MKKKIIRDSIHGYIEIPEIMLKEIIDTPVFQRLRQIEQTSMRALYPSAHHDRFVHSLGVYHLGQLAFKGLIANICDSNLYTEHKTFWEKYGICFQLACLLHDCAHAPMSHSFEFAYLDPTDPDDCQKKENRLLKSMNDRVDQTTPAGKTLVKQTTTDIEKYFANPHKIAPHEMASALLVSIYFGENGSIKRVLETLLKDEISEIELAEYIIFIQRAIIGLQYSDLQQDYNHESSFKNCLIGLLNGNFFDVDKLDYIVRDTLESGTNNLTIDIPRILNALTLVETHVFEVDTDVQEIDLNNSVYFTGFKSMVTDRSNTIDCECALNLSGVRLDGNFQGKLDFGNSQAILKTPTSEGTVNGTQSFPKLTKIQVTVTNTGRMTGKFDGKIELLNHSEEDRVDGVINAKVSGTFKGKIIGEIATTVPNIMTYEIGYDKNALSVIEDTLIARNRLYLWIYAHQKVTYNDYILRHGILSSFLSDDQSELEEIEKNKVASKKLAQVMNIDNIFFHENKSPYYLLNDGDLIYRMKHSAYATHRGNHFAEDWIERRHMHPIWKSYVEYNNFFSNLSLEQRKHMWEMLFNGTNVNSGIVFPNEANIDEYQNSILKEFDSSEQSAPANSEGTQPQDGSQNCKYVWIKPAGIKLKEMDVSSIYVKLSDSSIRRFKDVISQEKVTEQYADESFFYLYTSQAFTAEQKMRLVSFLKKKVIS